LHKFLDVVVRDHLGPFSFKSVFGNLVSRLNALALCSPYAHRGCQQSIVSKSSSA
jgi:hypothetical protein